MVTAISDLDFKDIFSHSTAAMLIVSPDAPLYTIIDVNLAYLHATNSTREELVGSSVFAAFPGNPTDEESKNIERTFDSFEKAISTKLPHTMSNYRYDIPIRGTNEFEERYWTTTNTPILDKNAEVRYFIHSPMNVTELYKLTERERASVESVKNQREQLYSIFMQAPVGIAILRGENYVVDLINPPLCELYGKTVDQMLGKPVFDVLTHAKGIGFEKHLDNVRLTGVPFKGEGLAMPLYRNEKLETAYVNFVYEPYREADGSITGVIAVATEITEQQKAREEQRKLITLVANSVDLMSILNMDGVNDYINEAGRKLLGFENEEQVASTPISELHAPEDFGLVQEEVLPTVLTKGRWAGKMMVRHLQTGEVFPVFNDCIRIDDPTTGEPIGIGAVMRDLRLELAAKQALADSEQMLRIITTAAPTGLWMSDENGAITYVNQTWVDWTGLPYEENLDGGWTKAIVDEDKERAGEKFFNDLANRDLYEVEFRINHSDGTVHWCAANGKAQYRKDGTFAGYIGACVDITEQKNLQQQKDEFIGIASHELKTPVTSIKAYTQVLEKLLKKKGDEKEAAMIGRMDTQLNKLTNLIGDLLDVTKINSGKLQFNNSEFDFNAHLKELLLDLQRTSEKHVLVENFEPVGMAYGDKDRVGQVITNLITNAIKYSPNSEKIIVYTTLKNKEIHLCVQDFGIGIPQNKLSKVFDQFYRVSGDIQHTFPGLGLGLYISSEIIKRERGRIWVTSVEGEGSTFCFALPTHNNS